MQFFIYVYVVFIYVSICKMALMAEGKPGQPITDRGGEEPELS